MLSNQLPHTIIRPIGIYNARRGQTINVVFSEISFKAIFVKPNRLNKNFLLANSPEKYWRDKECNMFLEAIRIKDACFDYGLIQNGFIDWYCKINHSILKGFQDFEERHIIAELNHIYKISFFARGLPHKNTMIIDECLYYPKKLLDYNACRKISPSVRIEKNYVIVPLVIIKYFEEYLFFDKG